MLPPAVYKGSDVSISSSVLSILLSFVFFLIVAFLVDMRYYCGFDFHVSDDWPSFYILVGHLYIFFGEVFRFFAHFLIFFFFYFGVEL